MGKRGPKRQTKPVQIKALIAGAAEIGPASVFEIQNHVYETCGKDTPLGSSKTLYRAAEDLERSGFLRSTQIGPQSHKGGRTKTVYSATPQGLAQIQATSLKDVIAQSTAGWTGAAKENHANQDRTPSGQTRSSGKATPRRKAR